MTKVTTESIIGYLKNAVEQKIPLAPSVWLDSALKMNVLLEDEHDTFFTLQSNVARVKLNFIENGDSVAKAKAKVEADPIYLVMKRQEARIERIEEHIRLAKVQARMRDTGMMLN